MPTFTKKKLLLLAALLLSLAMAACTGSLTSSERSLDFSPGESPPAETAYEFTLPGAPDGDVSLASYAGELNVVLVFYRGFW